MSAGIWPVFRDASSDLGSPIFNLSTRVGPSVRGPNTLFNEPPCRTSMGATNTRKPDNDFGTDRQVAVEGPGLPAQGDALVSQGRELGPGLSWAEGLL